MASRFDGSEVPVGSAGDSNGPRGVHRAVREMRVTYGELEVRREEKKAESCLDIFEGE